MEVWRRTKAKARNSVVGDLNDPESEISRRAAGFGVTRIRADLRTDPAIAYTGL